MNASIDPKLRFVQFLHPGGEHGPDRPGWKEWNRDPHRRKFMACEGRYLDGSGIVQTGPIMFWGEWEPPSTVERIVNPLAGGPRWLHRPEFEIVPPSEVGRSYQNTDPFVFGPHFHYAVCRQLKQGHPTVLNGGLARGSVILFGSHIRGHFALDTVFVVASALAFHPRQPSSEIMSHVSLVYKACALDRLGAIDTSLTFYCGATYEEPFNGMYSFVPCLPYGAGTHGFARPRIELSGVVSSGMRQGYRCVDIKDIDFAGSSWNSVVEQIVRQRLYAGVSALSNQLHHAAKRRKEELTWQTHTLSS